MKPQDIDWLNCVGPEYAHDIYDLIDQLAEAQRENERLQADLKAVTRQRDKSLRIWKSDEEQRQYWDHVLTLHVQAREQAEAQVKALQAEVKDERAGKLAMHQIAGEWEAQVRALRLLLAHVVKRMPQPQLDEVLGDWTAAAIEREAALATPPAPAGEGGRRGDVIP